MDLPHVLDLDPPSMRQHKRVRTPSPQRQILSYLRSPAPSPEPSVRSSKEVKLSSTKSPGPDRSRKENEATNGNEAEDGSVSTEIELYYASDTTELLSPPPSPPLFPTAAHKLHEARRRLLSNPSLPQEEARQLIRRMGLAPAVASILPIQEPISAQKQKLRPPEGTDIGILGWDTRTGMEVMSRPEFRQFFELYRVTNPSPLRLNDDIDAQMDFWQKIKPAYTYYQLMNISSSAKRHFIRLDRQTYCQAPLRMARPWWLSKMRSTSYDMRFLRLFARSLIKECFPAELIREGIKLRMKSRINDRLEQLANKDRLWEKRQELMKKEKRLENRVKTKLKKLDPNENAARSHSKGRRRASQRSISDYPKIVRTPEQVEENDKRNVVDMDATTDECPGTTHLVNEQELPSRALDSNSEDSDPSGLRINSAKARNAIVSNTTSQSSRWNKSVNISPTSRWKRAKNPVKTFIMRHEMELRYAAELRDMGIIRKLQAIARRPRRSLRLSSDSNAGTESSVDTSV